MANLGTIILLLICVGLGYFLEPLFFTTTEQTSSNPTEKTPTENDDENPIAAVPPPAPAPTIQPDISNITSEDFPTKVILLVDHTITDASSGETMALKKGTKVKPVRIEGTNLIILPVGLPIESTINIDQTNFKELAAPKILDRIKKEKTNKPTASEPSATPTPVPPPAEPSLPAKPEPQPQPETVVEKLGEAAIVALLKADVKTSKVTAFKADQVTAWKAGKDMKFDGKTYQTGRVTFKAETILGVQEHAAIALIQDGKVYKWMWAKTKLEMR